MQSRENLFEKQPFVVDLPRWITGLKANPTQNGVKLTWEPDSEAISFQVWKRIPNANVYPEWELIKSGISEPFCLLSSTQNGTFSVTAMTRAKKRFQGTVNYGEYLLFRADHSPPVEQITVQGDQVRTETISWTDETLPSSQEVWRIFAGVQKGHEKEAEAVLETYRNLIAAFERKDLDGLMNYYDPEYRDSNGYSVEYVRRAWLWWYQRTVIPYAIAQVRTWDTSRSAEGLIRFTAWNRFRGTIVWDEPFGSHGRVRIPRHEGDLVTWTWKGNPQGEWKLIRTEPALPNFGEILWIGRGHDVKHTMEQFADSSESKAGKRTK
jgi:PAS domain-containing protein